MALLHHIRRLGADTRGGVTIIGALSLTAVVGMTGLAMEMSQGYAAKVSNQRVADAAALAAGLAFAANSDATTVTPAAAAVVQANGLAAGALATPTITTDNAGRKLITVRITTAVPLRLAQMLTSGTSYNVSATGVAAVTPATPSSSPHASAGACFLALSSTDTYGINISGAASLTGNTNGGCDMQAVKGIYIPGSANASMRYIQANGSILLEGSGYMRATEVDAAGAISYPSWNNNAIVTAPTTGKVYSNKASTIGDPLAGSSSVQAALAKVSNAANYPAATAPAALTAPSVPASTTDWSFTDSAGSAGTKSGSNWTVPKGTYKLRSLSISGGTTTVTFAAGSTVTLSGNLTVGGSGAIVVAGSGNDWKIAGNVSLGGGGAANSFGAGTYHIGGTAAFSRPTSFGDGNVTIVGATGFGPYTHSLGAGVHSFGSVALEGNAVVTMGDGNLVAVNGLGFGGSTRLTLGTGTKSLGANSNVSMNVGGSVNVNMGSGDVSMTGALEIGGSSNVTFGAGAMKIGKNGSRSVFVSGSSKLTFGDGAFVTTGGIESGGDSNTIFGAAANHYINGTLLMGGAVTFGAGAYTINGDFRKTASNAGTGSNVSFFLAGTIELSGSASSTFSAPTSATGEALPDILFASLTSAAATYSGSSQNTYSGAVYLPNSAFTISGSGTIKSGSCFQLIAKTITISGSGAGASRCAGVSSASTSSSSSGASATVSLIR